MKAKTLSRFLCAVLCLLLALPAAAFAQDETCDVLVVGGGLAGLSAAISASESGAKVVLVEKLQMLGGSSGYSGGGIGAVGTSVQAQFGIEDSAEAWRALWVERQNQSLDQDALYPDYGRVDWVIGYGAELIDWMIAQGVSYPRPAGYGVDPVERLHFPQKQGEAEGVTGMGMNLIAYLSDSAQAKGVTVLLETRATELVMENGSVVGAVVEDKSGNRVINAKAVVLAAGGFAQSPELLNRFIPELPEVYSVASPGTTGDGILMAEKAGAQLYEKPWVIGLYTGVSPASRALSMLPYMANLYVAPNGQRVMNEAQHYALITNSAIDAGGVLYMVYDSSNPDIAQMIEGSVGEDVFKGDSFEALAEAAGIDAAAFAETMAAYNGYCEEGEDPDFGKASAMLIEVETAPFYAVKVKPNIMGTIGGVKTNVTGEALGADGAAIPGLYAAGECANRAFYNQIYMSGSALAVAATTGKFAGQSAAEYAK